MKLKLGHEILKGIFNNYLANPAENLVGNRTNCIFWRSRSLNTYFLHCSVGVYGALLIPFWTPYKCLSCDARQDNHLRPLGWSDAWDFVIARARETGLAFTCLRSLLFRLGYLLCLHGVLWSPVWDRIKNPWKFQVWDLRGSGVYL